MNEWPLFDSLAHPSLAGTWLNRPHTATFDRLVDEMRAAGVVKACAVGLEGMDSFEADGFAAACSKHAELFPVAGYRPGESGALAADMARLRGMGYGGVKLHPRFSRIDVFDGILGETMAAAADAGLVVFYCTYHHCAVEHWPVGDPFLALVAALKAAPAAKVVLLHGGDVELLRYMQLVRFNARLLLDLSMTLCKYPGSSLDADMAFLFREFDRRTCVGSDWPQHSAAELRARFGHFAAGTTREKAGNIAGGNLARFLGLDDTPWRVSAE